MIPVGACKICVHIPSVYTRNELVSRLLTDRELMEAYDMKVPDQKVLRAFTTSNGNTSSCAHVKESPLKSPACGNLRYSCLYIHPFTR